MSWIRLRVVKEENALAGGYAVAGLGPLVVVSLLSPLCDRSLGAAIVVLLLIVAIAVAAAVAGPLVGAIATVNSALWFDFLCVRPSGILKLGGLPVGPLVTLVGAGIAIFAIARHRSASKAVPSAGRRAGAIPRPAGHIQRIARLIEDRADQRDVITAVQIELTSLLLARNCRFEAGPIDTSTPASRIERDGSISALAGAGGELEVPVQIGSRRLGRFVLDPTPGVSVPFEHRLVAVILADHLAAAIDSQHQPAPRVN